MSKSIILLISEDGDEFVSRVPVNGIKKANDMYARVVEKVMGQENSFIVDVQLIPANDEDVQVEFVSKKEK